MNRQKAIEILKKGHRKVVDLLSGLTKSQLFQPNVLGKWSVKEIIAHLAAWNWEYIKEIDRVLENKATWQKSYVRAKDEDEFNKSEVGKRRNKTFKEVAKEWGDSSRALIKRLEMLRDEEWERQSGNNVWPDRKAVTVKSLFGYEYEQESHEAGHAKQIENHFWAKVWHG